MEVAVCVVATAALAADGIMHRPRVALWVALVAEVRRPVDHARLGLLATGFELVNVPCSLSFFNLAIVLPHSTVFKLALVQTQLKKVAKRKNNLERTL